MNLIRAFKLTRNVSVGFVLMCATLGCSSHTGLSANNGGGSPVPVTPSDSPELAPEAPQVESAPPAPTNVYASACRGSADLFLGYNPYIRFMSDGDRVSVLKDMGANEGVDPGSIWYADGHIQAAELSDSPSVAHWRAAPLDATTGKRPFEGAGVTAAWEEEQKVIFVSKDRYWVYDAAVARANMAKAEAGWTTQGALMDYEAWANNPPVAVGTPALLPGEGDGVQAAWSDKNRIRLVNGSRMWIFERATKQWSFAGEMKDIPGYASAPKVDGFAPYEGGGITAAFKVYASTYLMSATRLWIFDANVAKNDPDNPAAGWRYAGHIDDINTSSGRVFAVAPKDKISGKRPYEGGGITAAWFTTNESSFDELERSDSPCVQGGTIRATLDEYARRDAISFYLLPAPDGPTPSLWTPGAPIGNGSVAGGRVDFSTGHSIINDVPKGRYYMVFSRVPYDIGVAVDASSHSALRVDISPGAVIDLGNIKIE